MKDKDYIKKRMEKFDSYESPEDLVLEAVGEHVDDLRVQRLRGYATQQEDQAPEEKCEGCEAGTCTEHLDDDTAQAIADLPELPEE